MKRSFINKSIAEAVEFFNSKQFLLPPYAYFSLQDWQNCQADTSEIFDLQLGWDITSFGTGEFGKTGLLLFTLRNGRANSKEYPKPYAEKIMMVRENQVTPLHFHWYKREDIINRGGGVLVIELYHADTVNNKLTGKDFSITVNGMKKVMKSGEKLLLTPGESVCLEPQHAHRFWGEESKGTVLAGEVSMVNDDSTDNCFIEGVPRFESIEEDEAPRFLLANEYKKFLSK